MITNLNGLTNFLVAWLQDQAKASGTVNGCVGLSGGIDSAVVLALCARAFPKTVGVMMPCHSSYASLERAQEVLRSQAMLGYCVEGITVPLEDAFSSIADTIWLSTKDHLAAEESKLSDPNFIRFVEGSLRSCLRAPVLDMVSKIYNSLIYGTGNRDEDEIFRYYQKRGDGVVDNNVIVGLHKSEVRQLAAHLGLPQSVLDAVPSADLWGGQDQTDESELGVSYDEIEWVTKVNDKLGILNRRYHGHTAEEFAEDYADLFTARQLEVIEKAYAMELASRHKASPPAGVSRKEIEFFVL